MQLKNKLSSCLRYKEVPLQLKLLIPVILIYGLMVLVLQSGFQSKVDDLNNLRRGVNEIRALETEIFRFANSYHQIQKNLYEYQSWQSNEALVNISELNKNNENIIREMEEYLRSWTAFGLLNRLDDEVSSGKLIQKALVRDIILGDTEKSSLAWERWRQHYGRVEIFVNRLARYNLSRLDAVPGDGLKLNYEYSQALSKGALLIGAVFALAFLGLFYTVVAPFKKSVTWIRDISKKLQVDSDTLSRSSSPRSMAAQLAYIDRYIDEISISEQADSSIVAVAAANDSIFDDYCFSKSDDCIDPSIDQLIPLAIFDCFYDGVLLFEKNGEIFYANAHGLAKLGINKVTSQNGDIGKYIPTIKNYTENSPVNSDSIETVLLNSQGKAQPFTAKLFPLRIKGRAMESFVLIFDGEVKMPPATNDENWLHCITQELKPAVDVIQKDLKLLVAHLKSRDDRQMRELVCEATNYADSTVNVLNQMGELREIEAGKISFEYSVIPLDDCIESIKSECQRLASERDINVRIRALPPHLWVKVDFFRIQQVLMLLVKNAIRNSNSGDSIEINVREMPQRVLLSVEDYGDALVEDNIPRIFNKSELWRGKTDPERDVILAKCKMIVEKHGGKLGYNSEPGDKNAFYFNLPLAKADTNLHLVS